MRVGINGYEAVVPRFGFDTDSGLPNRVGSGEFAYQLLKEIYNLKSKNDFFIYLPSSPTQDMPTEHENWKYEVFRAKKLWTLIGLGKKLFKNNEKLDVFYSPTHYLPLNFRVPSVISILDVSYMHFPKLFKKKDLMMLKYWGKYSIKKSKKIITISESSKSDIINLYKVPAHKVEVVYPGIKHESRITNHELDMEDLKEKFGIKNEYILFVGTLQPRKNIKRLIEAYSKLNTEATLVIVGKKGWQFEEIISSPEKYGVKPKVKFIENALDEDLSALYKHAEFFILPSLYEGFGLPVLEAMSYGCPVITSDVSSLPEAGGDAALYVDPESTEDITKKMQELLDDKELREKLIKKGHEQVKKFSWEKSAKETMKVIESVVKSS
jgi:glycosyltransferase involved in cell wall biosynthesis